MAADQSALLKAGTCGVLVAFALVAAGAILDMKAAQQDSLELVMMAVRSDGRALKWADDFKDDKAVVLAAVQQMGIAVEFASERLRGDKEVALRAARNNQGDSVHAQVLKHLLAPVKDDLEVQLAAVRNNPLELKNAPTLKKDKSAFLDVVRRKPTLLSYADDSVKSDKEVVLEAVRQSGDALKFVHRMDPTSELLKDREVVLEAVRTWGVSLEYASTDLKKDREVVLAAVRRDGEALRYASKDLQKDPDVVMAAVVNRGYALKFAKEAQMEANVAAVFRDNRAIFGASREFKDDPKMVSDAAGNWQSDSVWPGGKELDDEIAEVMGSLPQDYSQRKEVKYKIELAAVRKDGMNLKAFPHLKDNKEVVDAALRQNGLALKHVAPKLVEDREVVLAAVRQDGLALEMSRLKDDKEVVLAAVQQNGLALKLKQAQSFSNDPEVVLSAVRQNGKALEFAQDALKSDRDVVLAAVRNDMPIPVPSSVPNKRPGEHFQAQHSQALGHADEKFRRDRDVVLEALRSNGRALEFVKVNEITATWESTITAGMTVLVLCIAVVVGFVFTPQEASVAEPASARE